MPLPTLLRQAREISVVIERQLPSEIANPRATIVFDLDIRRAALVLPRSPNEGSRPIFDRPEIPNYDKPEYLNEITRRLSAVLSAKASRGIPYTKPYNNRDVGNVEYRSRGSGYSRPVFVGPADVPKGPSYFLHDDRDGAQPFRSRFRGNSGYSRTDWRQTSDKDYYGARYRARNRSRYSPDVENGSPQRQRRRPQAGSGAFEDSRWTHDKYLELEHEDADRRPPDSYSPSSPTLSISERTKDDKSQLLGEEGASSTTPKGREGAKMETEAPSSDD
nr:unnamed protein product [Spirometra erinaceieuropaei]